MNAIDDIKAGLPEDPTRELEQRLRVLDTGIVTGIGVAAKVLLPSEEKKP